MRSVAHRHKLNEAAVAALHLVLVTRALGLARPIRFDNVNVHPPPSCRDGSGRGRWAVMTLLFPADSCIRGINL
jgi:hypothetical protein